MRHSAYFIAFLATALVACGGLTLGSPKAATLPTGTYRGAGTGAGLESLTALAARFTARHPGVEFKLEDVSAQTSVALVANGDADFGFLSRDLKPEEQTRLTSIPYAGTGTGLAVNPLNAVGALTAEQVRRIYHGKPTYAKNVIEVVESGPTYQAVRDFKGALAMITIQKTTAEDPTLRLVALDGIAATTRNVNSGVYPVRRPIILTLHPDPARTKPAVTAFFDFIKTAEGQEILAGF